MSTPIKPPGSARVEGVAGHGDGPEHGRVEGRSGELRAMVDEAARAATSEAAAPAVNAAAPSRVGGIDHDLATGRIDVDEAIERLLARALASASALPLEHRAALEAQLRSALAEDPTLIALRKDLERGPAT